MGFDRETDINGDCVGRCLCSTCMSERVSTRTPAGAAKSSGLKSLTQVSQITGVSLNTLTNWHRDKPELFRIVLLGCLADIGA